MAKVNFKRISDSGLIDNVPIEDGSIIVTGDGKTYVDFGENRIAILGTPDNYMSDSSSNVVENKTIKAYIDDTIKKRLLWTNSNPNSSFASQNVKLSSNDYQFLLIIYYNWTTDKLEQSVVIEKGSNGILPSVVYSNSIYVGFRSLTYVNETTLNFSDTTAMHFGGSNTEVLNGHAIPVKIYGFY